MENKQNKIYNNNQILNKSKYLIPHNTKLNNLKSNKYFTFDQNGKSQMKEALIKYRESHQKINKNDNITKNLSSNISSTMDISNMNFSSKNKFNKNNTIKLDKTLLNYAEQRTKVKEFHKIQPKIIDSLMPDTPDNINNFFENENNNKDNKDNIIINYIYKKKGLDKIYNNVSAEKYNKTIKMKNNNITTNISNNDTNVNEETINNENVEESIYEEFDKNRRPLEQKDDEYFSDIVNYEDQKQNLTETNDFFYNSNHFNLNEEDINYEYLLMTKKLYNELMKDMEINKMEIYQNKLSIIKDFLYLFNDEKNYKLYNIIDNISLDNNININNLNTINNQFLMKEYLIEQLLFFYIIILIGLIKKEKNLFHSGLLNLSFYFHQNFIVFIFIIINKINQNCKDSNNSEIINDKKKCIEILEENKTWLDKNNYKKYLQINNNLAKQILINLLNQIKYYFDSNPLNSTKNQKEKRNTCENNSNSINENEIIEKCIYFLLSKIKSKENTKIIKIIKEIKNFSPINNLLQLVKFDKIINHYYEGTKKNNKTFSQNDGEEYNIDNNIIEENPKEPFLQPINPKYKYTLVLDLDETLVHYISDNESAYIQIRPGAEDFIKELSEFYEIVIFTAALQTYADLVIDGIDSDGVISYRLYRQHTTNVENTNVKDLEKLGRDLKHVIIIDNNIENFSFQPNNGLNIIDFEGNEYDDELQYLKEDLLKLVKLNPDDVRDYLNDIQNNMDNRVLFFQKIHNENTLIKANDENNNKGNNAINDSNQDENRNSEYMAKYNRKGYSYTEESENIEDNNNN